MNSVALKRPTHRSVVILLGSLLTVSTLAVCAKYLPALGLRLFGPPRVMMAEAHANSSGKAQVDHQRLDRLLRALSTWRRCRTGSVGTTNAPPPPVSSAGAETPIISTANAQPRN